MGKMMFSSNKRQFWHVN